MKKSLSNFFGVNKSDPVLLNGFYVEMDKAFKCLVSRTSIDEADTILRKIQAVSYNNEIRLRSYATFIDNITDDSFNANDVGFENYATLCQGL